MTAADGSGHVFNADGTFNTNIPLPEYSDPTKNGGRVYFVGAFLRMVEIRNRNQCLHITCESKIQARCSICGRCGIVRFCSSECLTAAWTSPTHPHKMLCKQIQNLRAQSCLVDPHAWNRTIRDSSIHRDPEPFATACLATKADPNLAQAIVMGITYLTRERLNFLDKRKERIEADVDVGVSIPDQEGRLVESAPADFRGAGEGEVADATDPLPEEEVD
ncbi:hypothetical protein B0H11DRAFT_1274313 [Mycena galericulata]|nr:hypothetical protein B0H11DRAFT_1274313 [Mycena galericulata]